MKKRFTPIERALARVQEAESDIKEGRVSKGNLKELLK